MDFISNKKEKNTMQFCGLKDSGLERFRFKYYYSSIKHENRPVVRSRPYIMCCNYSTVQRENISIIIKVKAYSFEWCIICLSRISLDKATR